MRCDQVLLGDLSTRPAARAAVEALSEPIETVSAGDLVDATELNSGASRHPGDGVALEKGVQLNRVDMEVFLDAWSAGAAVLRYRSDQTYRH